MLCLCNSARIILSQPSTCFFDQCMSLPYFYSLRSNRAFAVLQGITWTRWQHNDRLIQSRFSLPYPHTVSRQPNRISLFRADLGFSHSCRIAKILKLIVCSIWTVCRAAIHRSISLVCQCKAVLDLWNCRGHKSSSGALIDKFLCGFFFLYDKRYTPVSPAFPLDREQRIGLLNFDERG